MLRRGWKPSRRFAGENSPLFGKKKFRVGASAFMSPRAAMAKKLFSADCPEVTLSLNINLAKHKVIKDGRGRAKALVCVCKPRNPLAYPKYWVYYPRPFYMPVFDEASEHVKNRGPASIFPGSVGSISVFDGHETRFGNLVTINSVQAHFITGKPQALTRGTVSKFAGWSEALLAEIFSDAAAQGKSIFWEVSIGEGKGSIGKKIEVFRKAAESARFSVTQDGNELVATPSKG